MRIGLLKPAMFVMLLSLATAASPPREPVNADFRLVTEVSRTVVRARLPVTVFANLLNHSDYTWKGIRVDIDASDKLGTPLMQKVFDGQVFESHRSKTCVAVFRFEEADQVVIRVSLSRGERGMPFLVRENAARIAVTPIDITGESTETAHRDGCH